MSENASGFPHEYASLAGQIHERIDADMARARELVESPELTAWFQAILPPSISLNDKDRSQLYSLYGFNNQVSSDVKLENAAWLGGFMGDWIETLVPDFDNLPEDEILSKVADALSSRAELNARINHSGWDKDDKNRVRMLTPYALVRMALAASEASAEGTEESTITHDTQRKFQAVRRGETITPSEQASDEEIVAAKAMNLLGEYYDKPHDPHFVAKFMASQLRALGITPGSRQMFALMSEMAQFAANEQAEDRVVLLGATTDRMGVSDAGMVAAMTELPRMLTTTQRSATKKQPHSRGKAKKAKPTIQLSPEEQRGNFLREAQAIMSARAMVDLFADGYDDSKLDELEALVMSRPLKARENVEKRPDIKPLDWEILPPGTLDNLKRQRGERQDEPDWEIDETRLKRLEEYIQLWGQGYIARSKIPNLPDEKQYYLAVLPQTLPDGHVIEHAIADSPITRHNAAYVWRAERGLGRFGQIQITWKEVFCNNRGLAKQLGARKIKHTSGFEDNLLEYVTRPVEALADPKYRVRGLGRKALQS